MKFSVKIWVGRLLLALSLTGCLIGKSDAEKVAFRFMDAYYVQTDPRAALPYTDSIAFEKVKQSVDLTSAETSSASVKPRISYKLLKEESRTQEGLFVFQVKITPEKAGEMTRKTMVRVRESEKGVWKVTQFSDQEGSDSGSIQP